MTPAPTTATSGNAVAEDADPLDLELDDVAPLQPAPVPVLEDAAGADRAGADDVAGAEHRVLRGAGEDRVPTVVEIAEVAARALRAVDAGDHLGRRAVELVGRDDDGAEARREILALRRAEA